MAGDNFPGIYWLKFSEIDIFWNLAIFIRNFLLFKRFYGIFYLKKTFQTYVQEMSDVMIFRIFAEILGSIGDFLPESGIQAVYSAASSRTYCAPQYGHFASPVSSIGRYTFGWEFHRYMPGIGQDSGMSPRCTS